MAAPDAPLAAPAVPMERDAGQGAVTTAPDPDWRLTLVPAMQPVPTDVRIGSSMPAPGQFRLSGEVASADFVLTLPQGVAPPAELLLSLRSSANVLPDHSRLTVLVNGVEAPPVALDNIGDFADKSVPVTGLVPGDNKIRLTVVQTHRILLRP